MPVTPSLTLELNYVISGQLIHATTNPHTMGKAYSNGCIGVNEQDIWYIFYYTPIRTKVEIKYDLYPEGKDSEVELQDIYRENDHVFK